MQEVATDKHFQLFLPSISFLFAHETARLDVQTLLTFKERRTSPNTLQPMRLPAQTASSVEQHSRKEGTINTTDKQ